MPVLEKPLFRFGEFELDPIERRLSSRGVTVAMTPKVFDTLLLLVERAGHAVSKDELMQALWPRGFVDESNLTKHVWLIRKALGDEHGGPIETIPKHGYRFTAAVQRIPRMPREDALAMPAPGDGPAMGRTAAQAARPSRRRIVGTAMLVVAACALVLALALRPESAPMPVPVGVVRDGGIAIVDFGNLSQNAKDAWLAPALAEMFATELSAGRTLHALPDELVRPARADLPPALAGGFAASSLAKLRGRLGADYVLSGSYLVSGTTDQPQLRIDLALQDARGGGVTVSIGRAGSLAELPALVSGVGEEMRSRLGIASTDGARLRQVAAAQPPTADVARRIGFALDALRRNDPSRARDELLDAVTQAPDYAPTYSYLAQTWSALGYKAKALAAAQQAAAHAGDLPEEQRLQIDAQLRLARHDWPAAIASQRSLVALHPNNPEYALQLVSTLLAGGKPDLARDELAALLKAPGDPGDPRFELAQARVDNAHDDVKGAVHHAERALEQARARDETGLAAEAEVVLGTGLGDLGDLAGAEKTLKRARADYARIGNPHGQAWVDQNLGNVWMNAHPEQAREAYQHALATYQSIGDQGGEAKVYSDLGIMLWSAGDRDGAITAVKKVLALHRETADLAGQGWALAALGTILVDDSSSDEAERDFRDAIALDERAGERTHRAFTLMQYADARRLRGDLARASSLCTQALQAYQGIDDGDGIASAEFECALVALDRGDIEAARSGIARARASAAPFHDAMIATNVDTLSGQIAMGLRDWATAATAFERATEAAHAAQLASGEAVAQALLAVCRAELGDAAAADRAAARAAGLRSRVTVRQEVFMVDIALAQLHAARPLAGGTTVALPDLAADADRRGWIGWSLEARLADIDGRSDPGRVLRNALEKDAHAHGFEWVVRRAERLPDAPKATAHG